MSGPIEPIPIASSVLLRNYCQHNSSWLTGGTTLPPIPLYVLLSTSLAPIMPSLRAWIKCISAYVLWRNFY